MPRSWFSRVRRTTLIGVVAIVLLLAVPSRASASLIQFDFTGGWYFFDPSNHKPEFWSAMAAYGIQVRTPVSFSMVVDDTVKNSSPFPDFFEYRNAIVQMSFQAGTMAFTAGRAQMGGGGLVASASPWIITAQFSDMPSFGGYTPLMIDTSYFQFGGGPAPGALIPFLSGWNTFSLPGLTLAFSHPSERPQVLFDLQLVGIKTVPAPSALVTLASSLFALMAWFTWRTAIQRRPSNLATAISQTRSS
jgi:hypothetical protein